MTFWKRQSNGDSKLIQLCLEAGGREGRIDRAQRIFRAMRLLYVISQ